jgi:hexosaminidase
LKFFPQYACPGAENPNEFCLGNPESERFIKAIFAEVMELFPESEYIHIGGDEANSANWEKCPICRKAMQEKNFQTMRELENNFMNRIGKFILDNHRKPILWGTCSGQVYPSDMAIQCWLDIREPLRVAANGNKVIYSVHTSLYLDYPANLSEPWETWMFELSERGIYMCDPYIIWPDKVKDAVLGTEACLWTETIPQWRVMQKLLPRLYAYSEAAWSEPGRKDYGSFVQRKELLEAAGYNQKIYSL